MFYYDELLSKSIVSGNNGPHGPPVQHRAKEYLGVALKTEIEQSNSHQTVGDFLVKVLLSSKDIAMAIIVLVISAHFFKSSIFIFGERCLIMHVTFMF